MGEGGEGAVGEGGGVSVTYVQLPALLPQATQFTCVFVMRVTSVPRVSEL